MSSKTIKTSTKKIEKKNLKTLHLKVAVKNTPIATDLDNLQEDNKAAVSNQKSSAAALAEAPAGTPEISASFKNFRHHPDMENFYRFICENDLRYEALAIINQIIAEKNQCKLTKSAKLLPH